MANFDVGKAIKAFYLQSLKVRVKRDNKKRKEDPKDKEQ